MSKSLCSMESVEEDLILKKEPQKKVFEPTIIKVGPAGSDDYDKPFDFEEYEEFPLNADIFYFDGWDGKGHFKIDQIFISYDTDRQSSVITSFQYQYTEDGVSKLSRAYGRTKRGPNLEVVTLDAKEYITRITGTHDGSTSHSKIHSLTFETNIQKYGPFGVVHPSHTNFKLELGQRNCFGGFFGGFSYSGDYLTYFGAYIMLNLPKAETTVGR